MSRGSAQLTEARKEEIIAACAALYEEKGFKDTTIKDIGEAITLTRTGIYIYFETKEEIFLALLGREYDAAGLADWTGRLASGVSRDQVAAGFAYSQEFAQIMASYGL